MRFDRLTLRGVGPFRGEVTLDLQAIPGQLVAVCGDNGAGKSVLLEAGLAGACYRKTPTRGTLAELAVSRETMVEAHVTNGRSFIIRQTIDAHTGKGESVVLDAETGTPLVESGKRRDVDRWVAEHLPPSEVLYSSVFGAQGSGGFLDLDPAPRKACIMSVLGHSHLEELSRSAGERARASKGQRDTCLARLADEKARGGDVGALDEAATVASAHLASALLEQEQAEARLAQVREAAVEYMRAADRRVEAVKRWEEAQAARAARAARSAELDREIADLDVRRANNAEVLEQGAAIRDAAAELEGLAQRVADARVALAEAERVASEAAQQAQRRRAEGAQAHRQADEAERAVKRLEGRVAERERVAADAARVGECERAVAGAKDAWEAARAEVTRLQALQLDGKDKRIEGLRYGLTAVANDRCVLPADTIAITTLKEDDALAESIAAVPGQLEEAEQARRDASDHLDEAVKDEVQAQKAAERLAELDHIVEDLEQARGSLRHWTEETERHTVEATRLEATAAMARDAAESARPALQEAEERHGKAGALARLLPRLEAAEARLEELDSQRDRMQAELGGLVENAAAEPPPSAPGPAPNLVGAEAEVRAADRRARELAAEATRAADALDRARASAKRVEELGEERRRVEDELADWRLLERDLGRNGVQALELDAAGPELTELANDLLHQALGPRFSVRIESIRKSADGKKDLEGCWVYVADSEANREAEARTFSGGERVLVGEAVNLAITMLGVRHAGLTEPTIVRDETGAALDGEKGRAYVAMLRRAAELVGASKVLFVSHAPELQELADARVVVGEGAVGVAP